MIRERLLIPTIPNQGTRKGYCRSRATRDSSHRHAVHILRLTTESSIGYRKLNSSGGISLAASRVAKASMKCENSKLMRARPRLSRMMTSCRRDGELKALESSTPMTHSERAKFDSQASRQCCQSASICNTPKGVGITRVVFDTAWRSTARRLHSGMWCFRASG